MTARTAAAHWCQHTVLPAGPEGGSGSSANTSEADLWLDYKAHPERFWDNRGDKRNPRSPDFKHRDSGQGLWLDSYNRPNWITEQGDVVY